MGFFGRLFGLDGAPGSRPDVIWFSKAGKYGGLLRRMNQYAGQKVLLAAHFRATMLELAGCHEFFRSLPNPQSVEDLRAFLNLAPDPDKAQVCAVDAALLQTWPEDNAPKTGRGIVLGIERFPLRDADDALVVGARRLPLECEVEFHLSLDDTVLRIFIKDSVVEFLRSNSKPDQPMESNMVSNSIKRAQERIRKNVVNETPCESVEAWLTQNRR
ncbi:MAG: hypothetical protein L6R28_16080 [Planctomycetes bacterium]|nr:hypothetical protein [Planctomycetota bacterium]